jgi:hypothetical protein
MNPALNSILWRQFGAAIDTLDNAFVACPDTLWTAELYPEPAPPVGFAAYWYNGFHTLFFLDLYLTGTVEGFLPPAPFTLDELDPAGIVPEQPYSRDELRAYLVHCRAKAQATIENLTSEQAHVVCSFPWGTMSFLELQLYSMRHVQEHAAQLNLFLGQMTDAPPGWVKTARGPAVP